MKTSHVNRGFKCLSLPLHKTQVFFPCVLNVTLHVSGLLCPSSGISPSVHTLLELLDRYESGVFFMNKDLLHIFVENVSLMVVVRLCEVFVFS